MVSWILSKLDKAYSTWLVLRIIICLTLIEHLLNKLFGCSASYFLLHYPGFPCSKLNWDHKYFSSCIIWVANYVPSWSCNMKVSSKVRDMSRSCRTTSAAFFVVVVAVSGWKTQNLVIHSSCIIIHFKLPRHMDCVLTVNLPHARFSLFRTDLSGNHSK